MATAQRSSVNRAVGDAVVAGLVAAGVVAVVGAAGSGLPTQMLKELNLVVDGVFRVAEGHGMYQQQA